ncbi:hypothetical protein LINGRAHAP2_LOCUS20381, partial [Linum grandiflorum]
MQGYNGNGEWQGDFGDFGASNGSDGWYSYPYNQYQYYEYQGPPSYYQPGYGEEQQGWGSYGQEEMPHWNELQPSPTFYQDSITTSYYQAYPFIHHRACKVKTWSSQPLWFLHQSLRVLLSTQSQSLKKLMGMKEVLSWSAKPRYRLAQRRKRKS